MDDKTAISGTNATTSSSEPNFKKMRGMFFGRDLEKEVSAFKNELFGLTNNGVVLADVEFSEINRLVDIKTENQSEEGFFTANLVEYLPRLKFLFELSFILKRIQPYCEFVDDAILPHMRTALAKIRTACGCDLDSPQTWSSAHVHTAKICEEATRLEISKLKLNGLYDHVLGDMEWFVMSFKSATWESKRYFFVELNKDEKLLAWMQPWINVAEGKEANWRKALYQSIDSLSAKEVVVERRVYE
ncbi:MAG: hypothetical protein SFW07_04840 [Gammaproteobacteria bacterium]|nr:hypothetical protein [Gammaproteobacteria bacterium]